ncbi:MAG: Gfo/Idh/MocA family oxidoreductase [Chloroflexi bacterium]|nr:Gfo/Idh/MocA family oxidoreductase [Chloroflexota bacterium]MCL5107996.1 Gfo/Idh/MocA family oxidoreductase [Chloroflexota bacterium]
MRIGIVGTGNMASLHASILSRLERVRLTALVGSGPGRAGPLAEKYDARGCDCLEDLLEGGLVDAVDICSPSNLHAEQAILSFAAGKHVLCEKPIALTVADCDRMIEKAQAAGVKFMVGHTTRFWPEYVAIQRILAEGRVGAPQAYYACRLASTPLWRKWFAQGSSALYDLLIHDVDLFNCYFGKPKEVAAAIGKKGEGYDGWNHVQVALLSHTNVIGQIEVSYLMPRCFPVTFESRVLCEHGALEYRFQRRRLADGRYGFETVHHALKMYPTDGEPSDIAYQQVDAYEEELSYFVKCVQNDTPPALGSPEQAREALTVVELVQTLLDSGTVKRDG